MPEADTTTVTVAEPDLVESACEVAVTVIFAGFGTVAGAVYTPVAEIVPLLAPPLTLQVTAVFIVPVTVAVKVTVWPISTVLFDAVTVTEMRLDGGAVLLPPPQALTKKMIDRKNSPMAARVMNVPWGDYPSLN
jgi:hypothetical protein